MTIHRIYTLTSIGRPVDVRYPTNRAMLILLAPAAILALALALWQGVDASGTSVFVASTILAAFGAWALGRELAPDDQAAAFAGMGLAIIVMLILGPASGGYGLLVMFVTLGLVRQVNRTTGLEARLSDSIVLLLLSIWVIYSDVNPLFGLVAALSFFLDGFLPGPLRRQWVFALISLGAFVVYMVDHDLEDGVYSLPHSLAQWITALIAVIFALNLLSGRKFISLADVGRKPLNSARVRGGMLVALVAVVQGLPSIRDVGLVAAALAGVCLTAAFRRSFSNPI